MCAQPAWADKSKMKTIRRFCAIVELLTTRYPIPYIRFGTYRLYAHKLSASRIWSASTYWYL